MLFHNIQKYHRLQKQLLKILIIFNYHSSYFIQGANSEKIILPIALLTGSILYGNVLVYGPGGAAPVLKELAQEFNKTSNEKIEIIAGPTSQWIDQAKSNADIIYSGNSTMMDSFIKTMPNQLSSNDVNVLNIREAWIVMRPNNPKNIKNFNDLFKKGIKIMVVDGAGQVGLYEDMALKDGKIENLQNIRKNIVYYAPNSKAAIIEWNENKTIDAIIIWSHWAKNIGEDKAEFISLKSSNVIYRAAEIAITKTSQNKQVAQKFIDFINSEQAQDVWKKHKWEAK